MFKPFQHLRLNLVSKLILSVGLTLLLSICTWAYFNIKYQTQKIMNDIMVGTDRLSNTIILGAHYAMMLNSREDINHIINNISKQKEIDTIRIYNKKGQIKFSNRPCATGKNRLWPSSIYHKKPGRFILLGGIIF